MLSLDELDRQATALLADVDEGQPLDELARALIGFAVAVSVTSLDTHAIRASLDTAKQAGATLEQIQEIASLVSGLGVHSLMMSSALIADTFGATAALDAERTALWAKHVGDDPYWEAFEAETPGFLRALLVASPAAFEGFFSYCAIPWATRSVRAYVKELAALACDATPTHRFGPGFRVHINNAVKLGVGRRAIAETIAIARRAPTHHGVS